MPYKFKSKQKTKQKTQTSVRGGGGGVRPTREFFTHLLFRVIEFVITNLEEKT